MNRRQILATLREHLQCSVTRDLLIDPAVTETGHTYEAESIAQWLRYNPTDPCTNLTVAGQTVPNLLVRRLVERFADEFATLGPDAHPVVAPISRAFPLMRLDRTRVRRLVKQAVAQVGTATAAAVARGGHAHVLGVRQLWGSLASTVAARPAIFAASLGVATAHLAQHTLAALWHREPALTRLLSTAQGALTWAIPLPHSLAWGVPALLGATIGVLAPHFGDHGENETLQVAVTACVVLLRLWDVVQATDADTQFIKTAAAAAHSIVCGVFELLLPALPALLGSRRRDRWSASRSYFAAALLMSVTGETLRRSGMGSA